MKRPAWAATWFAVDPRALGVFRIAFGVLALLDILRRVPYVRLFYTNDGVAPNHWYLYTGGTGHSFSLLYSLSSMSQVVAFFLFATFCLIAFTLGWRTRLFHILSALCMWSIHGRVSIIENGGDVVMNLWWLWTIALPLGARYSIDALRADMGANPNKTPASLNVRSAPSTSLVWSLSVFAVIWQLAVIYFFNTVHKNGVTWKDGSALWWVFEQDRILRPIGRWMIDTLPGPAMSKALTWGTLVVEGIAPILLFTPLGKVWARRLYVVLLGGLHIGIYATVDVGLFSPTMMIVYPLLLSPQDYDLMARLVARFSGKAQQVWYDSDCGVCHLTCRVLARLDRFDRLTFLGRDPEGPLPPGWTREQLDTQRELSIITADDTGAVRMRSAAIAAILDALPFGRLYSWPFKLPGLKGLLSRAYHAFGVRRHTVSAWLGLGECGFGPVVTAAAVPKTTGPKRLARRVGTVALTLLTAYGLVCTGSQILKENKFMRDRITHKQPRWAQDFVKWGRFFQGWGMFAPDAPRTDGWVVMDFTLADGTHIDPQTGMAPHFTVADGLHWDVPQIWAAYSWRVSVPRRKSMRKFLRKWMSRRDLPHFTLPAGTHYIKAEAWWIGDRSPNPYDPDAQPVETERRKIVSVTLPAKMR